MWAQLLVLLNLTLHRASFEVWASKGNQRSTHLPASCCCHREPGTETASWQFTPLPKFLWQTEGRGILEVFYGCDCKNTWSHSRSSLQSHLTEVFIGSHLCVLCIKNFNSNPTLFGTQDTVFIVHESTCEHLTHNATQRQNKKNVVTFL